MTLSLSRRPFLAGGLALSAFSALPASAQIRGTEEMSIGSADAPVTVVEYVSFTCPHCQTFHETVFPDLKSNFIDPGQVRFVMREVYFDRPGLWAGMIARCAGADRYFGVVDLIFERQAEWTRAGSESELVENLFAIGRQAGMTDADMNACLTDEEMARAMVEAYQTNAEADRVEGTPTFIVNGRKHSNMGYEAFAEVINTELGL